MKPSGLLFFTLVLVTAFASPAWAEPTVTREACRPNIIFVLTDDQGYGDLSFLETPNLDRLHDAPHAPLRVRRPCVSWTGGLLAAVSGRVLRGSPG
jgi:hypothetical protein